jgi:hypothetical protein
MYICYLDESGDDGVTTSSSYFFVLTSLYMHHQLWKDNYEHLRIMRRQIKQTYGLPIKTEFHTSDFIKNRHPYRNFNISDANRKQIIFDVINYVSLHLDIKIINTAVNKRRITQGSNYQVLDNALKYNVQRIENDLNTTAPGSKFLIITDEGRLNQMVKTTRRIQKINFIPSHYGGSYLSNINKLIEDPLGKESHESYFIQLADLISYIVQLYLLRNITPQLTWGRRVLNVLNYGDEITLLNMISNRLNLQASSRAYGIVLYP